MNKLGFKLLGGAIALGTWYFASDGYFEDGDYYIDEEIDQFVQEYYFEDNGVSITPVATWLEESPEHKVYEIDRYAALTLAQTLQAEHGIELLACIAEEYESNEAGALIASIGPNVDHKRLATTMRTTIPEYAWIDFGKVWMSVELY